MSEFMKSIVQEVLNRNHGGQQAARTTSPASSAASSPLEGLHRPNYQRKKSHAGAGQADPTHVNSRQPVERKEAPPQAPSSPLKKDFIADQVAALQRLTTAQGTQRPTHVVSNTDFRYGEGAQLIGKTRNGQFIWFFPRISAAIAAYLDHGVASGTSMGMIIGRSNSPGTLFLLDDLLKNKSGISCEPVRQQDNDRSDVLKIYSHDQKLLQDLLKEAYNLLHRKALRPIETYIAERPSRILTDCLEIAKGESVALLEGVSYFNSLALVDRQLQKSPQTVLHFDIRNNYLLATGDYKTIESVFQQLKRDAEQLLT